MDLSSLMEIQVTSAGRKEQNLFEVPAAIYVIDQDDIKTSSATSIPELLRMVPGLQVARISSSQWAISSRGFNGTYANKLLVQIDGRTVYTPSYSGVYWEAQHVLLEDIDRIEVIRGPGATLWGANAVNGIINVITKSASKTVGGVVSTGTGNHEEVMASFRYGKKLKPDVYGRFYVEHHEQDEYRNFDDGTDSEDDWWKTAGGFRIDGSSGLKDNWTLQGDFYDGDKNEVLSPIWIENSAIPQSESKTSEFQGYNVLGRWQRSYSEENTWTLQLYYDYTDRDDYIEQTHKTIDVDFQHRFQWGSRNDIVWGAGYRNVRDQFGNNFYIGIYPDHKTSELISGFLQDEVSLIQETLWLTLGSKLEHNDYTGTEIQPSARLLWKLKRNHSLWTSISRAVRTPSRTEDSGNVITGATQVDYMGGPMVVYISISGNPAMEAEELLAYEAGYRYSSNESFSIDLSLFHNDYKNLSGYVFVDPMNIIFENDMEGRSYGGEFNAQWTPMDWLKAEFSYSFIDLDIDTLSISSSPIAELVAEGSTPQHQLMIRTGIKLKDNLQLNLTGRYVDAVTNPSALLNSPEVDPYFALDANIHWRPWDALEVVLAGQNITDSEHLEFVSENFTLPTEVTRSIYINFKYRF